MKRRDWSFRSSTERKYQSSLLQAGKHLAESVKGLQTLSEITAQLLRYTKSPKWQEFARQEASRMVRSVIVENAKTWREAAHKGQRGREIHQLLKLEFSENPAYNGLIEQNSTLIKTLPADLAEQVSKRASSQALAGMREKELVQEIQKAVPGFAEWKAQRIARTEVAKAQATVTKVRSQQLGIKWYIWQTSHDQRVRTSHDLMQGVLCRYNDPPSPEALAGIKSSLGHYGPGECPNCRCYAEPVIDFDDLPSQLQVCMGGKIQKMSKKRFMEVA